MKLQTVVKCAVKVFFVLLSGIFLYNAWLTSEKISSFKIHHSFKVAQLVSAEKLEIIQEDWQPVTGSKDKFGIYSAYSFLHREGPAEVMIIGIAKPKMKDEIHCHFHSVKNDDIVGSLLHKYRTKGTVKTMKSGNGGSYAGVFINCPLPKKSSSGNQMKPDMVSVLLNKELKASNSIQIQYLDESEVTPYRHNFSVCVKPTFNLNEVTQLLEWMEFYKLMGVSQFTLYNMTIGPEASCILNDLKNGGDPSIKVNVFPWNNHQILKGRQLTSYGNVPQYSIAAAQNDCVYRHRGRLSKHMAFVDLDEFILPREDMANNFDEMINLLDSQHPGKNYGEYLFRNGFFLLSRPDDPMLLQRCYVYRGNPLRYRICRESLLMKKVMREDYRPYTSRTKYIIKPEGVKETANHHVNTFESGYGSIKVPEDVGFLRHYRNFEEGNHTEVDRVSSELGLDLVEKIFIKTEYYKELCDLNY